MPLRVLLQADVKQLLRDIVTVIEKLGQWRDGLLLAAGALYLLGYLTWALYGQLNSLGFIPVLDSQYFAAGIVPAAIICLLWIGIRFVRCTDRWLTYPPTRHQVLLGRLLLLASGVGFVALVWLGVNQESVLEDGTRREFGWRDYVPVALGACFYLSAVFFRNRGWEVLQKLVIYALRSYLLLVLLLWLLYAKFVMPKLPSELGGAQRQPVVLDIDSAQISAQTRATLANNSVSPPATGVIRTQPVSLIFVSSDYFFLSQLTNDLKKQTDIYRIRKDSVKAVFPYQAKTENDLKEIKK